MPNSYNQRCHGSGCFLPSSSSHALLSSSHRRRLPFQTGPVFLGVYAKRSDSQQWSRKHTFSTVPEVHNFCGIGSLVAEKEASGIGNLGIKAGKHMCPIAGHVTHHTSSSSVSSSLTTASVPAVTVNVAQLLNCDAQNPPGSFASGVTRLWPKTNPAPREMAMRTI